VLFTEPLKLYINVAAMAVEDKESVLAITYSRLRYEYTLQPLSTYRF
jgi:hypothetical protein